MNYKRWQPEEIAFLKASYSSIPIAELESQLGRSFNCIKTKASELRLERKPCLQKESLEHLYCDNGLPAKEIARLLGRSKTCILKNLHKYGIPVRTTADGLRIHFQTSQISSELLRHLYHTEGLSCNDIGKSIGIDGVTVNRYLRKFGVALRDHSDAGKKYMNNPQRREVARSNMKARWQDPKYREQTLKLVREAYRRNPDLHEKRSRQGKINWQDPEYVKMVLGSLNKPPTKLEKQLGAILDKHFPEFKYNGDGRLGVTLGGLIPDFVNVNGKKQVIEVFGDYWHSPEIIGNNWRRSELGRIMIYNSVGWGCLVIWQHELKELTEEQILTKITKFEKEGKI